MNSADAGERDIRPKTKELIKKMNEPYKKIKVRFIGENDPLALLNRKIYDAFLGQKGMICLIDETGNEYAYHPSLFEIIEREDSSSHSLLDPKKIEKYKA